MENIHVVCPHCHGVNRLPAGRLTEQPVCGRCRAKLFAGSVAQLDYEAFQSHVRRSQIPVLIDFWAPWCGPCKMMAPAFLEAARALEPQVRLVKVNTEKEPSLGRSWNIRSIPTMVLVKDGREVARQSGAMDSSAIIAWTRSHL
ncbi:MAG: thioredoxin TrxC [Thermodesulfobacteriota bacterium]